MDPLQPPEAAQELAPVVLQLKVELPPTDTVVGSAASVTVGVAAVTAIITL
jgi:hypothetical protein